MVRVALFGAMWGVGNVSYGLTMRHLGMSLGIGVAIGVTLIVGTLVPPLIHGQAAMLFSTRSGLLTMAGVLVALIGVAVVSYAGHQKEVQLGVGAQEFNVKLGLALAVMCGIFSSGMSFAIDAAKPIAAAAQHVGVNSLYAALPSYVLIMGGGAVINLSYCFIRLAFKKEISLRADLAQPRATLLRNGSLAAAGGIMWYLQFFFYAWGAANIPSGSVELWTGNAALTLDAGTGSGNIHCDRAIVSQGTMDHHHLKGAIGGGGPAVHIGTGSGNIHIH
jgi:L-rhamnose-H+ transport protein